MSNFFSRLFGGGKSSAPTTYEYTPYSGRTPQSPAFTTESEKAIWDILSRRSQGQDVGYDPSRKLQAVDLLKSQLGKKQEDDVRAAQGTAAAAGLGGNLRAQEALAGRVNRDYGRTLGEGITQLNIEDLAVANQERQANTQNLQRFNEFEFGQGNNAANFDMGQYKGQEALKRASSEDALAQYWLEQGQQDERDQAIMGAGLSLADMAIPGMSQVASPAVSALAGRMSGQGIAPDMNTSSGSGYKSYYTYPSRRSRVR